MSSAVQPQPTPLSRPSVLGKRRQRRMSPTSSPAQAPTRTPAPKRTRRAAAPSTPFVLDTDEENPFVTPRAADSPIVTSAKSTGLSTRTAALRTGNAVIASPVPVRDLHLSPVRPVHADHELNQSPSRRRSRRIAKPATLEKASLKLDLSRDDTPDKHHSLRIDVSQHEDENTPTTPRRATRRVFVQSRVPPTPKVPLTPRHRVLVPGKPLTPRSPAVGSLLVPQTPRTAGLQHPPIEVYRQARQLFVRSIQNADLVGREQETATVQEYLAPRLSAKASGCLYVSGPPGTGKTAFMTQICNRLAAETKAKVSVINCMGVKSGRDLAHRLIEALDLGNEILEGTEMELLKRHFHIRRKANLVLLDEIDYLLGVDLDFMNTLFEWALEEEVTAKSSGGTGRKPKSAKRSNLCLVGIANALDFTDRFLPKLKAQSVRPELVSFGPYSADQIAAIITAKLRSLLPTDPPRASSPPSSRSPSSGPAPAPTTATASLPANHTPFIHPAAVSFLSKKVAAQTGDLRRAFDLARSAIDAIEAETRTRLGQAAAPAFSLVGGGSPLKPAPRSGSSAFAAAEYTVLSAPRATIGHVARITAAAFTTTAPAARIRGLNLQQKAVLCTLVGAVSQSQNQSQTGQPKSAGGAPLSAIGEDHESAFFDLIGTPSRHQAAASARFFRAPQTPTRRCPPSPGGGGAHGAAGGPAVAPTLHSLFAAYSGFCKLWSQLAALSTSEFVEVVSSLEAQSLVSLEDHLAGSRTPGARTPKRGGGIFSGVSAGLDDSRPVTLLADPKEVREICLEGPGEGIMSRILNG